MKQSEDFNVAAEASLLEQFTNTESRSVFKRLLSEHPRREFILQNASKPPEDVELDMQEQLDRMVEKLKPAFDPIMEVTEGAEGGQISEEACEKAGEALKAIGDEITRGTEDAELKHRCRQASYVLVDAMARKVGFARGVRLNYRPALYAGPEILNVTPELVDLIAEEFDAQPEGAVEKFLREFERILKEQGSEAGT
jgi:hypothetical protein